ncbi:ParB/RepB/Spo0J family partition protein [Streptomyces sp. NPDC006333]|uniref:ParB/RepB/Spo0J family partition protein n=1 Tax=Streptomyces sp. NPDC006333 TaxID=3156753 RepID=UPI0033A2D4E1
MPTDGVSPPTELPVDRISLNPANPRSSFGDLTDLAGSLKTHGQKQAITVMNRDAFIKANPQREGDLEPNATHVVVDGSSRLAAARQAGLSSVKVMVSDDQGTTSDELLESALVANIHRQDLEELDEARALHQLLSIHGSQRALAKRLHRSQGWVSQRLSLLNLVPELQARIGEEPIDLLRAVGNKPAEQQEAVLLELKAERARKEEALAKRREQETSSAARASTSLPGGGDAVTTNSSTAPSAMPTAGKGAHVEPPAGRPASEGQSKEDDIIAGVAAAGRTAPMAGESQGEQTPGPSEADRNARKSSDRNKPGPDGDGDTADDSTVPPTGESLGGEDPEAAVPEPRKRNADPRTDASLASANQPRTLPYDDPSFIAMHLALKMDDSAFFELLRVLIEMCRDRDPAEFDAVVREYLNGPAPDPLAPSAR